ncbi:MAG: phosphopantetheine-binding protein [Deltaproteobacteria bacterium]
MQKREEVESEIKGLIIEALALEDIDADEIETAEPLFVEGLGLDSIDALELAMQGRPGERIKGPERLVQ